MQRSNLCDYSDAYIPVYIHTTISVPATQQLQVQLCIILIKKLFKNCAQFTSCITEINKTQVNDAQDNDIVMSMYKSIEYSDAY